MATQDVARLCPNLFRRYHEVRLLLEKSRQDRWREMLDDVRSQLAALTGKDFLWKLHGVAGGVSPVFSRNFAAAEKLPQRGFQEDRRMAVEIGEFQTRYEQRNPEKSNAPRRLYDEEFELFRSMLEEYRVSCFAQPWGLHFRFDQALEKQWEKALRSVAGRSPSSLAPSKSLWVERPLAGRQRGQFLGRDGANNDERIRTQTAPGEMIYRGRFQHVWVCA